MNTIINDVGYDPFIFGLEGKIDQKGEKVAEEVESLFIYQLLKEMDKTVHREENDFLFSRGEEVYRGLFNQEIAREMARSGGMGLQEMIMMDLNQRQAL